MKAPCRDDIHHTTYVLVRAAEGDAVYPFPESNFHLTTDEHQQWVRDQIAQCGFRLVLQEGREHGEMPA